MNGDDVALLRNDIKHLTEKVDEQREALLGWQREYGERVAGIERMSIRLEAWKNGHVKEHERISEQLGELQTDVKGIGTDITGIKADIISLNHNARNAGVKGGVAAGLSLTAIIEAIQQVLKGLS